MNRNTVQFIDVPEGFVTSTATEGLGILASELVLHPNHVKSGVTGLKAFSNHARNGQKQRKYQKNEQFVL